MSVGDFIMNENFLCNSEILCDSERSENISESDGNTMVNESSVSEETSFSNSEILSDELNNENASSSDSKIVVNDIESDENSSYYTDSGISSTTSPVVLYLRPEDHINEESSVNVLQNKSNNKERPFSCNLCDKTFKRRAHYNVHLYTHNSERQFVCKTCNKAFAHHYFLKNHEYTHNTEKQFTCEFCNEEFSVRRYYTRHIRCHTKKKYECDACDVVCYKLRESTTHVKTHGDNFFSCDKCDRCFCQELSLNLHHCFESDLKRFSCKLCPKAFRKIWDLESHEAVHENKKLIVCDICNRGFNTKYSLKVHIQTTHDEDNPVKPYSCQSCEKKFHLQANLKRHEVKHKKKPQTLDIEPGPVAEYQSRINQKPSVVKVGYLNIEAPVPLQQMIYFIPGKKINYVCDICLKGFRYRYTLTVHRRRHTGEKPFECPFCRRSFADKGDLKRHIRIHTGDRKYACDACGRTFTRKVYMTTHFANCIQRRSLPKIESVFSVNENSV